MTTSDALGEGIGEDVVFRPVLAEALTKHLDGLQGDLRRLGGTRVIIDSPSLERLSTIWKREAHEVDVPIPEPSGDAPSSLDLLIDPRFVLDLVDVRPRSALGLVFLVPVIVAWLLLGVAEAFYARALHVHSVAPDVGFFSWWSDRPFGPFVYSFAIAGLLALVGLVATALNRASQESAHRAVALVDVAAIELSVIARQLLRTSRVTSTESAAVRLGGAATQMDRVVGELRGLVADMRSTDARFVEYRSVTEAAERSLAQLSASLYELGRQSDAVSAASSQLGPVLETWNSRVQPTLEQVSSVSDAVDRLQQVVGSMATTVEGWTEVAPQLRLAVEQGRELAEQVGAGHAPMQASASSLLAAIGALGDLSREFEGLTRQLGGAVDKARDVLVTVDALQPVSARNQAR